MRHLSSATSWLRQALGVMERRKSLIALPLNPPPGCYNLPPFLPPSPSPTPLLPFFPFYSPLPISPEATRILRLSLSISPPCRLVGCTAALCGSSVTGHSYKETWTPQPGRSQWFVNCYYVSELSTPLTNDLITPETVGGGQVFILGTLCQKKCCWNPFRYIADRSTQPGDRNGYLVSIFFQVGF